jgi:hypothetical protein
MIKYWTDKNDVIEIIPGMTDVFGRKGDDRFIMEARDDVRIDGGFGHDTFEFQLFGGQTFTITETSDDRSVVKLYEDGEQVQKIVLLDVEQVDWFMVG